MSRYFNPVYKRLYDKKLPRVWAYIVYIPTTCIQYIQRWHAHIIQWNLKISISVYCLRGKKRHNGQS